MTIKSSRIVGTNGLVLLDDRGMPKERCTQLIEIAKKAGRELSILRSDELGIQMDNLLVDALRDITYKDRVLCIFPGNGGREAKKLCRFADGLDTTAVFAHREWIPGTNPSVFVGEIEIKETICLKTGAIVVIDDVISSGQTIALVYKRNQWKFPRAKWYAGCWVARGKAPSCYTDVFAGCTVVNPACPEKKPPINSLSTLLDKKHICADYSKRNFRDMDQEFLEVLDRVKEEICSTSC